MGRMQNLGTPYQPGKLGGSGSFSGPGAQSGPASPLPTGRHGISAIPGRTTQFARFGSVGRPAVVEKVPGSSGFQKLAFRAGLGMLFARMTALPELLAALTHTNTYLLYLVGPPAL